MSSTIRASMMLASAIAFTTLGAGCKTLYMQTDGFPEKLQAGCKNERECRALVVEAQARVARCKDNMVGYVPCSDANGDLRIAQGFTEEYDRAAKKRDDLEKKKEEKAEAERRAAERAKMDQERAADRAEADRKRKRAEAEKTLRDTEKYKAKASLCEASREARAARKRHAELGPTAAFTVRKECKVLPTKVDCPKGFDPEVMAIGTWKLGINRANPFPEDDAIGVSDEACEEAAQKMELAKKAEATLAE